MAANLSLACAVGSAIDLRGWAAAVSDAVRCNSAPAAALVPTNSRLVSFILVLSRVRAQDTILAQGPLRAIPTVPTMLIVNLEGKKLSGTLACHAAPEDGKGDMSGGRAMPLAPSLPNAI